MKIRQCSRFLANPSRWKKFYCFLPKMRLIIASPTTSPTTATSGLTRLIPMTPVPQLKLNNHPPIILMTSTSCCGWLFNIKPSSGVIVIELYLKYSLREGKLHPCPGENLITPDCGCSSPEEKYGSFPGIVESLPNVRWAG